MRLLAGLEGCAAGRKNTFCCAAQPEEVALAHEAGLSYGKYRAFLEAQALDPSLTPQEVQGMSMREIREMTEALAAGEEPAAQGAATAAEAATEREIKEMAGARGDEANTRPCPFSGKRLLIFQALTSGLWAAIIRW